MNAREQIQSMMSDNKEVISANLSDFWRGWAQDLMMAGINRHEVVETMLAVAMTQCVNIAGATKTADYLEGCAAKMYVCADAGVEYPIKRDTSH